MKNYNEFKNYIHNELGITREDIELMIKKTIQDEVNKLFRDETKIKTIIEHMIKDAIKKDERQILYRTIINFDNLLDEKLQKEIYRQVKSKVKISLVEDEEYEIKPDEFSILKESN